MCFEWDERFRRERAERLSKEKVDELIRRSEEAAKAGSPQAIPAERARQPATPQDEVAAA